MKRRRTFGGREGVWFRCKRSGASSHAEKSLAAAWDDVRGRPVDTTGDASTVAVSSSDDDEDNLSCDSLQDNNDVSLQGELLVEEQQDIESSQSSTGFTPKEQQQRKRARRGAFGSRKPSSKVKEDDLFSDLHVMPRKRKMTASTQHSQSSAASGDDDEDNAASSLAPSSQHSSLLSQDSSTKRSLHSKETDKGDGSLVQQQHAPISNEKSVFDFDISSQESSSSGRTTAGNKKIIISNHNNITTPATASLQQPTARTSLSVARAYFARLDASSPLTHTSHKSPTKNKAVVRRTRRRTARNNPELAQEFAKYRQMCQEAGVSPMLLQEYIQQRENFVSRKRLYDGFLDE